MKVSVFTMSRQRGSSMMMVIMIGVILLAMAVILMSGGGQRGEEIIELREKYQSYFLAKGGQQHALLKFRLLPTPFYDAAAYAIGKNPYFDFSKSMNRYSNPGPAFFTGTIVNFDDSATETVGEETMTYQIIERGPDWSIEDEDKDYQGIMSRHLRRFLIDIKSGYPAGSPIIQISTEEREDLAMGNGWYDPFDGEYLVDKVFIFGSQGAMNYATDSVMVSCRGWMKRENQVSIAQDSNRKNLTRMYVSTSTQQSGSGFKGMADVSNAEKFEFLNKHDTYVSQDRGQAVTAIYEVNRHKN
jgi:hypothetical protein